MSAVPAVTPMPVASLNPNRERYRVLLGALLVMTMLGVVYGFSALTEPVSRQFPSWSHKDIQFANTLALLFFAIAMVPAGWLQDRYGPRLTPLMAAFLFGLAFFLASQVTRPDQKVLWWVSYGVLYGSGVGLATVSPLAALNKWFPEKRGLVSGIALMGFGLGAAVFIPTASSYLDTHTLSQFFQIHMLVCSAMVATGALLLKNPPPMRALAVAHANGAGRDVPWTEMLRTGRFWTLWLLMALSCTAGLMTIAVVKAAVKDSPVMTAAQASLAGSILSLMNALGRPFWGSISDRLGRPRTMAVLFGAQAAAMFLLSPGLATGAWAAFILVGVIGMNFGGAFGLFAPATAESFGTKYLGVNYGWVFTGYGVAGIIGPLVAAYYKDTLGVFGPAFLVGGALAAAASALAATWSIRLARQSVRPATTPVVDVEFGDADEQSWLRKAAD